MSRVNDIQQAISELNIHLVEGAKDTDTQDRPQQQLLPQWKDITAFVDEAVEEFEVGQLVHLPSFTLCDAMSAIEIMDPKMDTGIVITEKKPEWDVTQRINASQLVWVMDRLLSCEMAWISGHALSQTIFTCIYFHHINTLVDETHTPFTSTPLLSPEEIVYNALGAYVLATIKCCYYVWREMKRGNVFEEEDFITNLFGLHLGDQFTDVRVLNAMDTSLHLVRQWLEKDNDNLHGKAILNRLKARKSYMVGLAYLSLPRCSHFVQAKVEFSHVIELLKSTEPSSIQNTLSTDSAEILGVFDPNINRKLISQAPPRPITLYSDKEAYDCYGLLVERLASLCTVPDYHSTASLMNYFVYFADPPYPDAFCRSTLNTLFYHDLRLFGTRLPSQSILNGIEELVQPVAWWLVPSLGVSLFSNEQIENAQYQLNDLLERITPPFIDFFKIQCQNRARQRRILCKVLEEWDALQESASSVDETFHTMLQKDTVPYYLSCWIYHLKLGMMENILGLGFELELYGLHEYIMLFWYLQYVLDSHLFLLSRIESYAATPPVKDTSQRPAARNTTNTTTTATATTLSSEAAKESTLTAPSKWLFSLRHLYQAKKSLSVGLYRLLVCVGKSGQLPLRELGFDDEETRFRHRFKSFATLSSPPPLHYTTFMDSQTHPMDINEWLKSASDDFRVAKSELENVLGLSVADTKTDMCTDGFKKDILSLMKTCVANNITIMKLMALPESMQKVQVEFKYHPRWPVVLLVN